MSKTQDQQQATPKKKISIDLPSSCFSKPRANKDGDEFLDVYLPKGFEIKGNDLDGNDLSGRDLGEEHYYMNQTLKKDDMTFIYKSRYFEGGRRFTQNVDYPITLKQRVQNEQGEWLEGPQIKVDAAQFDKSLKDWQYAKDENGRTVNIESIIVPKDMVKTVEDKDGNKFYVVDCPTETVDNKDISDRQFTFGYGRQPKFQGGENLMSFTGFKGENIPARNPEDRKDAVWVDLGHANLAYKIDRRRMESTPAKEAPTAKQTMDKSKTQAKEQTMAEPSLSADAPKPTKAAR